MEGWSVTVCQEQEIHSAFIFQDFESDRERERVTERERHKHRIWRKLENN